MTYTSLGDARIVAPGLKWAIYQGPSRMRVLGRRRLARLHTSDHDSSEKESKGMAGKHCDGDVALDLVV